MGTPHSWKIRKDVKTLPMYLNEAGYETHLFGLQHETRNVGTLGYKHFEHGAGSPGASSFALDVTPKVLEFLDTYDKSGAPFYMDVGFIEAHMFHPRGGYQAWAGNQGPPRFKPKYVSRSEIKHYRGQLAVAVDNPCDPYRREYKPEEVNPLPYLPNRAGIREDLADLYAVITNVIDAMVGRILAKLKERNLEENTLVIFTTDHGIDMPRTKGTLYDPGLEVALIMRFPKRFQAGTVQHPMLSHADFLPTVLEAAGVTAPENIDGRSFLPLIEGRPYEKRESIFLENTWHLFYDPMRGIRTDRFKYIRNFAVKKHYWAVESKAAREVLGQVCYGVKPIEEFYDLEKDPYEKKNLAPYRTLYLLSQERNSSNKDGHEALPELRKRLRDHMIETSDPLLKGPVIHPHYDLMWD
jgi:arylsulfatase A-like enzyme